MLSQKHVHQSINALYDLCGIQEPEIHIVASPKATLDKLTYVNYMRATKHPIINTNPYNFCGYHELYIEGIVEGTAKAENAELCKYLTVMKNLQIHCGHIFPLKEICVVTEKPSIIKMQGGLLHCDHGPALLYIDGWGKYYLKGRVVDKCIVMEPQKITLKQIAEETDANLRSILIEQYGLHRFIRDTDCVLVHTDGKRKLYKDSHGTKWLVGKDTGNIFVMQASPSAHTCADAHQSIAGFADDKVIYES